MKILEIIIRALVAFIITMAIVSEAMALAGAEEHSSCNIITKLNTQETVLQMGHLVAHLI